MADASHKPEEQPRAWQRMLSGRRLDLLSPDPNDVEIEDIAHGLARVARWNGQTTGAHAFSVAQHCLLVDDIATALYGLEPRWRLATLLHDAPEYVIGDLISPFKAAIGLDYKAFELRLLRAIHLRYSLPAELPAEITAQIKNADRIAAYIEASRLAGFSISEADKFFGRPESLPNPLCESLAALAPWPTDLAQKAYLERFRSLFAGK